MAPLIILMVLGAMAELMTIGVLLPFLGAIADPGGAGSFNILQDAFRALGVSGQANMVYALAGLFAVAALTAAAVRLLLLWVSQKFVYGVAYELAVALYANTLHQPYSYHVKRNSSETIAGVNKVQIITNAMLMPLVQASVASVISLAIVVGLIAIDPGVAIMSGVGFALIYLIVTKVTRAGLRQNSGIIAAAETDRIRIMREGLGGIRDVLLDRSQPVFIEAYERVAAGLRDAQAKNAFYAQSPRFLVEGVGMALISLIAVTLATRPGGFVEAVPVLGALALGAQRLLPLIQQMYNGWAMTVGNRQSLVDVVEMLAQPTAGNDTPPAGLDARPFESAVTFNNVSFAYSDDRAPAVHALTLTIDKGARVGLVGKTGSGKSTLVDLLVGLLEPTEGSLAIDGVVLDDSSRAGWQRQIAHVPQFIYLADATIAENIAFGVRHADIDMARVQRAAEQAQLSQVIADLPKGYETMVGEGGVKLSGGQRQRLGIARALYRQANVLVLDEATSALDTETETAVMKTIEGLTEDLTIIIIAHRLSTVAACDMVIRLDDGRLGSIERGGAAPAPARVQGMRR